MKMKSLLVITLFAVCCSFASAQKAKSNASGSFALGFLNYTGGLQYCDYEVVGYSDPFAWGTHNLTTVCGLPADGVMVGLKGTIPPATGMPVTGAIYGLADNTFDAEYEGYTGCQLDWVTQKKASSKGNIEKGKYGWLYFYSCEGGSDYLGNYGFLSVALGARNQEGVAKTSYGKTLKDVKSKR